MTDGIIYLWQVVLMNTLSSNLHTMMVTHVTCLSVRRPNKLPSAYALASQTSFYRPTPKRHKILVEVSSHGVVAEMVEVYEWVDRHFFCFCIWMMWRFLSCDDVQAKAFPSDKVRFVSLYFQIHVWMNLACV